jgi:hypothetical protein
MEQPITFAKFNEILQGIERERERNLEGKWPDSQAVSYCTNQTNQIPRSIELKIDPG